MVATAAAITKANEGEHGDDEHFMARVEGHLRRGVTPISAVNLARAHAPAAASHADIEEPPEEEEAGEGAGES